LKRVLKGTSLMSNDIPTVMLCFESPNNGDAQRLIRQLDEDLIRRYPALPAPHGLLSQDLVDPSFTFVIARIDGIAVGCGALRRLRPDMGEIKRMFVVPEFRGRGIARRILEALESRARELRYVSVCLETGCGQPEAIGLYKSAGYYPIAAFGEYVGDPFSVCFQKRMR
jgi:putative acetyltransferase